MAAPRWSTLRSPLTLALLGVAAAAWAMTILQGLQGMPMITDVGAPVFMGLWVVMMVAMMLPSAMPMVLAFARFGGALKTLTFVGGYLLLWAAFGLVALAYALWPPSSVIPFAYIAPASGAVLVVAGAYQFSLPKERCLTACRGPMEFLMGHGRSGSLGALIMGLDYGVFCLGCCWALMVALVFVGAMAPLWVGLLAIAVFIEKARPDGALASKGIGVLLGALGIALGLRLTPLS